YPASHVVALEPDPENAALARLNLAPYGARATLIEAALWPRQGSLHIHVSDRRDSVRVDEVSEGQSDRCAGVDPISAIAHAVSDRIDLFKCDIEGAEEQLYRDDPDPWLEKTGCIVIEIHSRRAEEIVYGATKRHGFRAKRHRDLHIFERSAR